jgi:hypothetical protein
MRITVKLIRAVGGCLGIDRRRRTRQPAKSFGELDKSIDPEISEWGNPVEKPPSFITEYIGYRSETR